MEAWGSVQMEQAASSPTPRASVGEALWRRVRRRVWERRPHVLLERDLASPIVDRPARVPVSFAWADTEALRRLVGPELHFTEETLAAARGWLLDGDRCLVGYLDGRPVNYRFLALRVRRFPGVRTRLGDGHAHIYRGFTIERLRGLGVNQAALSTLLARCRDMGLARVFADVDLTNASSLRSVRNVGFRDVGTFDVIRVWRWRRAVLSRSLRGRLVRPAR